MRQVLLNGGGGGENAERMMRISTERWASLESLSPEAGVSRAPGDWMWREDGWCPLLGCADADDLGVPRPSAGWPAVLDDVASKVAALHASVEVLEQVLLSDVMVTNQTG